MGAVTIQFLPKAEATTTITNLVDSRLSDDGINIGIGVNGLATFSVEARTQNSGLCLSEPLSKTAKGV